MRKSIVITIIVIILIAIALIVTLVPNNGSNTSSNSSAQVVNGVSQADLSLVDNVTTSTGSDEFSDDSLDDLG